MKKMIFPWIIITCCLFGTILFIGIRFGKTYKPYYDYEADIKESANIYLNLTETKLKNGDKKTIKMEELLKTGTLSTNKVKEDTCDGYVTVKKMGSEYQYDAYIKCKNYTTVDYKK